MAGAMNIASHGRAGKPSAISIASHGKLLQKLIDIVQQVKCNLGVLLGEPTSRAVLGIPTGFHAILSTPDGHASLRNPDSHHATVSTPDGSNVKKGSDSC